MLEQSRITTRDTMDTKAKTDKGFSFVSFVFFLVAQSQPRSGPDRLVTE